MPERDGSEGLKSLEKCLILYTDTSMVSQREVTKATAEVLGVLVQVKQQKCARASAAGFCNVPSVSWVCGDGDKKWHYFSRVEA